MPSPPGLFDPEDEGTMILQNRDLQFSQSLDARKMTKSKVHSEDPKFWSNL